MAIVFENLSYTYSASTPFEFEALKEINLTIETGKITALVGATGSGKSTLVQHLNALLTPTTGRLFVDDKKIEAGTKPTELKKLRKKVGLVFQFPEAQLFEEDILKEVAFGPKNFGYGEPEATALAKDSLRLVGIEDSLFAQSPLDLSGGQKRRVAIAGVLATNPDILVCDEPTAGLDPQGSIQMMELFKSFNEELNKTIILVTHDMEHVLNYADNVVVLDHGRVIFTGTNTEFFENDELLQSLTILPPKVISMRQKLIARGFDIPRNIFTMDELVKQMKRVMSHE